MRDSEHAFVVGATTRSQSAVEAEVSELGRELQVRGKLARWWSFRLSDDAESALKEWPYVYIYVGVPTQGLVARHRVVDFKTSSDTQGQLCPWPEYQDPDLVGKTSVGPQKNQIFRTWFLVDSVEQLPSPIPLDQLETRDGRPALAPALVGGFGLWRVGSQRTSPVSDGQVHLLLKWAPGRAADTIERHRRLADQNGSVWWGAFGAPGSPGLSDHNLQTLVSQLAANRQTYAFLYGGDSLWQTQLRQISVDPADVDDRLLPDYYKKAECKLFVRIGDFVQLPIGWARDNLALARDPSQPLSQGALGNQTTPLLVSLRGDPMRAVTWIFQSSPDVWDLRNAIRQLSQINWLVSHHASEVKPGDRVYMWEAGATAGILAVGTVTDFPADRPNPPEEARFNRSLDPRRDRQPRVNVRLTQLVEPPLSRQEIQADPALINLSILKQPHATNFPVTPSEAIALDRLLASRLQPLPSVVKRQISTAFQEILSTYPSTRQGAPFAADNPIWSVFHRIVQSLQVSEPLRANTHLKIRFSVGQGNWAKVPWIAIMDDRETTTTQRGIYCVYLFRQDGTGVYATLNQGVMEPQRERGAVEGKNYLRAKAKTIRTKVGLLAQQGFLLDDNIDMKADKGLGSDYEDSTIAYRLYEKDAVPDDNVILRDLEALLEAYRDVIDSTPVTVTLDQVFENFSNALTVAGLTFGQDHGRIVRAFLASLMTKPLVILTGLTGSGKTQVAIKFGEWLGTEHKELVPVRPDWTGPEALFGYEDLLRPPKDGSRPWAVPRTLEFMLRAARDPGSPYLLVLDEMNLAHVERYFADFLSGMETTEEILENLVRLDGDWRVSPTDPNRLAIPRNLFVVGTVNVDETTYMFSPKVLDRANTLEFQVRTEDLLLSPGKPSVLAPGDRTLVAAFLKTATDDAWQDSHPAPGKDDFIHKFIDLHRLLSAYGAEFGHRTIFEAVRFAAIYAALGEPDWHDALDLQLMQKVLPKLHGSRRKLEDLLIALAKFCVDLTATLEPRRPDDPFDPLKADETSALLPISLSKVKRMLAALRADQFTSFTG